MKKLLTIMALGALPMLMSAAENMKPEKISLNKGWEFSQVGKGEWLPATVPGTVHQDLIDNGKLRKVLRVLCSCSCTPRIIFNICTLCSCNCCKLLFLLF